MSEAHTERNLFDIIREHSKNKGDKGNQALISLAEEALRSKGVWIPSIAELTPEVTKTATAISRRSTKSTQAAPQSVGSKDRVALPSKKQLVIAAKADTPRYYGIEFSGQEPADDLYEDFEKFAKAGCEVEELEVLYQPYIQFDPEAELDPKHEATLPIWRNGVKPGINFWNMIINGDLSSESAILQEGWFWRDKRAKPAYKNGHQKYANDKFLEGMILKLRGNGIEKYEYAADDSRLGISSLGIEDVLIPVFVRETGVKGIVEYLSELEFNTGGNRSHPEWGRTNTSEWLRDKLMSGRDRLVGGHSGDGGLAYVHGWSASDRYDDVGFRLQGRYPSQ
ncbi:hypothetical protein A3F00_03580 [Candidatus Daviesbacteria bacterium RIFCSPHIGHO2_12_FULL_37_11]|uniref:Uncharacterized protein n=1 Tax=Candidatus Daviesbacteria bacterium RIFCSPHIGHO2_12_FULL_37_11 TaxID=1797777 RepID=A0A1F5KCQ0_9BACT|nr:MAG: hypothetical protein A3F00_03580 [Candidatus Daviesbacteria bacterium RIFCSPHIGHO2_12_FULL_37_11]